MTDFRGSCASAADQAAKLLIAADRTALEVKIGVQIASRGDSCFETDNQLREIILRRDGTQYHRESIGRARRALARAELISSRRIHCGQKVAKMRWPSPHGTTDKRFCWEKLGAKNPMPRRERAILRQKAESESRAAMRSDRPRYSVAPPAPYPGTEKPLEVALRDLETSDPTLAALVGAVAQASLSRHATSQQSKAAPKPTADGPPEPE
jgi:hypothetical protein